MSRAGSRRRGAVGWPGRTMVVVALCLAAPAFAQGTGRIEGRVVDGETGEPLIAAQVMVESTDLGSFAREDGTYFIDGVPAGEHRVTTEYLGYREQTRELVVRPEQVATADFALSGSMIDTELIVAIVERPKFEPPEQVEAIVVEVSHLPRDLPDLPTQSCVVELVKRSGHIVDGRWRVPQEVSLLRCGEAPPPCPDPATVGRRAAR